MRKLFVSRCYICTEVPDLILLSESTPVDTNLKIEPYSIALTDSMFSEVRGIWTISLPALFKVFLATYG